MHYRGTAAVVEAAFSTEKALLNFLVYHTFHNYLLCEECWDKKELVEYIRAHVLFAFNGGHYECGYISGQNISIHDKPYFQDGTLYSKSKRRNNSSCYCGYLCIDEKGKHIDLRDYAEQIREIYFSPEYKGIYREYQEKYRPEYYEIPFRNGPVPKTGKKRRNFHRNNRYGHLVKEQAETVLRPGTLKRLMFDYGHAYRQTEKNWKTQGKYRHQWEKNTVRQNKQSTVS